MDRYGSCGALIDTHDAYTQGRHDRYPGALDTAPCLQGLGTCVSPRCRPDIGQRSFYDKAIQGADTFSKNRDVLGVEKLRILQGDLVPSPSYLDVASQSCQLADLGVVLGACKYFGVCFA